MAAHSLVGTAHSLGTLWRWPLHVESNESVHAAGQGVLFYAFKRLPLCSLLEFFEKVGAHTDAPEKPERWSLNTPAIQRLNFGQMPS